MDKLDIIANVKIAVFENGELVSVIEKHNLVVTLGKNLICDLLAMTAGVTGLNYFAVGTGGTAVALSDSSLQTEIFRDTLTKVTVTNNNVNVQYYLASTDANGSTLTEAALFGDDASGTTDSGTLFARVVHSNIVKTSSVAVTYSWDITFNT